MVYGSIWKEDYKKRDRGNCLEQLDTDFQGKDRQDPTRCKLYNGRGGFRLIGIKWFCKVCQSTMIMISAIY